MKKAVVRRGLWLVIGSNQQRILRAFGSPGVSNRIPAELSGRAKCSGTALLDLVEGEVFESSSQRPDGSIAWLFFPHTGIRRAIGLGAAGFGATFPRDD